jgi:hypothetical protein
MLWDLMQQMVQCIEARMDLVPEVAPYVLVTPIFDLSTTGR